MNISKDQPKCCDLMGPINIIYNISIHIRTYCNNYVDELNKLN